MNKIFEKISFTNFTWLAAGLCIAGDLLHAGYAYFDWFSPIAFENSFLTALSLQGISAADVPPIELQEMQAVLYKTIWLILTGFMLINTTSYLLVIKKNKWGIKYTKFICITSVFLCFFAMLKQIFTPDIWLLATVLQIMIYLFVYLGFRFYPEFKKSE